MAFTTAIARAIGRHFVTLSCLHFPPGQLEPRPFIFSGFVVEIAEQWFYVTAGHILRDIQLAMGLHYRFESWRLGDQTAGDAFVGKAVPYDFDIDHWCVLEDAAAGLDYAALPIRDLYRKALEAGGVVPIDRSAWGMELSDDAQWALCGIPSESVAYDGRLVLTAKFVVLPLLPCAPPDEAGPRAENQLYARIEEGARAVADDIDGLSGAPVFSLRYLGGAWRYEVIGIQSSWYEGKRIIAACPLYSFASGLEPIVKEALQASVAPRAAD